MSIRAKILSDQHLEFRRPLERAYLDAMHREYSDDLLIVAGDLEVIGVSSLVSFQALCCKHKQVIYVPGNHDYYGSTWEATERLLRSFELQISNLKILRSGDIFEWGGRRFLGDTMWVRTNRDLIDTRNFINDSYQIADFFAGMRERNDRFLEFLDRELQEEDIVITHHLPSEASTPPMFRGSPTQPWFVCDMEHLIFERNPAAWIHGHTHTCCEYLLGAQTKVICNPCGYPGELGENRWDKLKPSVFEI